FCKENRLRNLDQTLGPPSISNFSFALGDNATSINGNQHESSVHAQGSSPKRKSREDDASENSTTTGTGEEKLDGLHRKRQKLVGSLQAVNGEIQREEQVRTLRKDIEHEKQISSKLREQTRQIKEANLALVDELRSRDARTAGDNEANKLLRDTISEREQENRQLRQQVQALSADVAMLQHIVAKKSEKQSPNPATSNEIANTTSAEEVAAASPIEPKVNVHPQAHQTDGAGPAQIDTTPRNSLHDSDDTRACSSALSTPLNPDLSSEDEEKNDSDFETLGQHI
ncbi:MAG: hypothetical protein Q9219_007381, partial [cf. Caloplaca sp. 3 TL-2023]